MSFDFWIGLIAGACLVRFVQLVNEIRRDLRVVDDEELG